MRRRWLVAVAALVSLSASCSGGPIRSASATETSTYEARGSVASAAPAFDQIGGCNEATFWAVNHEETVAVEIRTAVPIDRGRVIEFDLAGPGETLVLDL